MKKAAKFLRLLKRKAKSFRTENTTPKASQRLKSWSMYNSCKELTLDKYIEITETANYSLLDKNYDKETDVSSSPVPAEDLIKKWEEIEIEYTSLMAGRRLNESTVLQVHIELLMLKYDILLKSIELLRNDDSEHLRNTLKDLGYPLKSKFSYREKYLKELDIIFKKAKSIHIEIDKKVNEFNKINTVPNEAKNISKEDDLWIDSLIVLSDFAGYNIKASEITVYEYAKRFKAYLRQAEKQQKKKPSALTVGTGQFK